MAASIPYLRPFMESLESGYMGNHDIRRKVKIESGYGLRSGDTYVLSAPATNRQSKVPEVKWQFEEIQPGSERHTASAQSTPPRSQTLRAPVPYPPEEAGNEIGMAIGDESAIQPGGITHTVEYSVRSEPRTS